MSYLTVAKPAEVEEVVKGSRFLGFALTVHSASEAGARLEEVRERHPDASHHPWAYVIGAGYRFFDDGEPGGTADRPMLEVLQRRGLDHVLGVVRYFGGT